MTKPITPEQALNIKEASIPDEVYEAFNELLAEGISIEGYCTIYQSEAIDRIQCKLNCERDEVSSKGWLDVETQYIKAGWEVEYDKPGYNENYEAHFKFSKPRK